MIKKPFFFFVFVQVFFTRSSRNENGSILWTKDEKNILDQNPKNASCWQSTFCWKFSLAIFIWWIWLQFKEPFDVLRTFSQMFQIQLGRHPLRILFSNLISSNATTHLNFMSSFQKFLFYFRNCFIVPMDDDHHLSVSNDLLISSLALNVPPEIAMKRGYKFPVVFSSSPRPLWIFFFVLFCQKPKLLFSPINRWDMEQQFHFGVFFAQKQKQI